MDRFKVTKRVGTLGIIGNIVLLIIKAIVGVMSKSQAMIADAANSAGDIFASAMTAIGNKIASEPKDETHNFGHGKAEYIFSLFISMSMIVISFKILFDSIASIVYGNIIEFSWWLLAVCIITIITKLALYMYSKSALKKCKNILLESNMKDHRNDCIVTAFTTLSIILSRFNINWFDGVVGVGISIWIFYTGAKIFIESYNVLMDSSLDTKTTDEICNYVTRFSEVKGIESIHSIPTGYKYMLVITILVEGNLETYKSHEIADKLQEEIEDNFEEVDKVIVHVEPIKEEK
ncbi:MAG: cation transporter [Clostridia bacterium]|nr:cation transporter [Clostridia bacterium]